jgi:hypothetical protein
MLWGVIYQECRRRGKGSLAGASVRGDTMNLPELFVTGLDERGHPARGRVWSQQLAMKGSTGFAGGG